MWMKSVFKVFLLTLLIFVHNASLAEAAAKSAEVPVSEKVAPAVTQTESTSNEEQKEVEVKPAEVPAPVAATPESAPVEKQVETDKKTLEPAPVSKKTEAESVAEKKEEKKEEEKAIEGLDTVSVKEPEGNWLLKRIWWEKAKKKYAKIKRFASKIADLQLGFIEKRNNINRDVFDPFYVTVGLDQGQLTEVISSLMEKLKELREKEGSLDKKERVFFETLKSEEKTLKQLKLDVASIRNLNAAIDDDIKKLVTQINRSRRYEEEALQIFFDIAKVLNHKKARELYYQMASLWRNIKSIDGYIRGKFSRHFDTVIENAKTQVERIKGIAADFKNKGLDLKKQFAAYGQDSDGTQQPAIAKDKEDELRDDQGQDDQIEESEQDDEPQQVGWLGYIWSVITWPFRWFWGLFS